MEAIARNYLRGGDLESAANFFTSLENLNPIHSRMARICRVLRDPIAVPLPHRHQDICDALLEPDVSYHMLLAATIGGSDVTMDVVQKRYQRLLVNVHPDKNPLPLAKDAFLRLRAMYEEASRSMVEAESDEESPPRGHPKGSAAKSAGGPGPRKPAPPGKRSAPFMPNLAELKRNKITLKSLKRKDIDDDFEIFRRDHINNIDEEIRLSQAVPQQMKARPPRKRGGRPAPRSFGVAGASSPKNEGTRRATQNGGNPFEKPDSTALQVAPHPPEEDPLKELRGQISSVISDLAHIRQRSTAIHLTTDFSMAAYERAKEEKRVHDLEFSPGPSGSSCGLTNTSSSSSPITLPASTEGMESASHACQSIVVDVPVDADEYLPYYAYGPGMMENEEMDTEDVYVLSAT